MDVLRRRDELGKEILTGHDLTSLEEIVLQGNVKSLEELAVLLGEGFTSTVFLLDAALRMGRIAIISTSDPLWERGFRAGFNQSRTHYKDERGDSDQG